MALENCNNSIGIQRKLYTMPWWPAERSRCNLSHIYIGYIAWVGFLVLLKHGICTWTTNNDYERASQSNRWTLLTTANFICSIIAVIDAIANFTFGYTSIRRIALELIVPASWTEEKNILISWTSLLHYVMKKLPKLFFVELPLILNGLGYNCEEIHLIENRNKTFLLFFTTYVTCTPSIISHFITGSI